MKTTEFARFPKQWLVCRFLDVIDDITAGNFKVKSQDYLESGSLSIIDQGQSLIAGYTNNLNYEANVQLPAIVFGDHTRIFKFIESPFALGADGAKILEPKIPIDKKYLYYYLSQIQLENLGYSRHFKLLKETYIPLPPLPIQRHIARVLDQADQLRKQAQQMETELSALAQSVFLEMFGDPELNPKGWAKVTIRDLITEVKYGSSEKASETDGLYPILRMNNITYSGDWDFSSLKYIDLSESEKDKYLVKKGDILFNRTNSKELVGKTAVYRLDKEMAYAGYLIRMRCNEFSNPEYIAAYLNSAHGKKTLMNMCKSIIGMANINAQELQNIEILKPPKSLQDMYANKLEKLRVLFDKNREKKQELDLLFNALVQKAFKGELIPTTIEDAA